LIELLVVVLIIGILVAIAIPSFLGQTAKANDAQAKALLHSAQVAAESIASDHDGSYASVTPEELHSVEPTIQITETSENAYLVNATGGANEYTLTAKSKTGDTLTVERNNTGEITRTCVSATKGAQCGGAGW
jgi:type IV pilus assembly protein PilA